MKIKILKLTLAFLLFTTLAYADISIQSSEHTSDGDTKLLLHCNGSDTSQTFTDSGDTGHTVTAVGNAQLDTDQKQFGSASGIFDKVDDYLTVDNHTDFSGIGTGDFTVEFWIRFATVVTDSPTFICVAGTWQTGVWFSWYNVGSANRIDTYVDASYKTFGTFAFAQDDWTWCVYQRTSGETEVWIDGVTFGTASNQNDNVSGTSGVIINTRMSDPTDNQFQIDGWYDEIRFSRVSRYANAAAETGQFIGIKRSEIDRIKMRVYALTKKWWKNFYWVYIRRS